MREGKHLAKDLIRRVKVVRDNVRKVRELQPASVKRYRQALHERISKAGVDLPLDDDRLAKEVIFFADRSDITEELTRLDSHFAQFAHMLRRTEPVGRTLEFMSQEIGRESTRSARRRTTWRFPSCRELQSGRWRKSASRSRTSNEDEPRRREAREEIRRQPLRTQRARRTKRPGYLPLSKTAAPAAAAAVHLLPSSRSSVLRG
jgi:hypothetical protein